MDKTMEGIFRIVPKGGKPVFQGEDAEKYFTQFEGVELIGRFSPAVKSSQKQKLFNYYHGPVLDSAIIAYTQAGHSGVDKVVADYKLRAEVGKGFTTGPGGEMEPYLLSKEKMTAHRLWKFVCDSLFYLEENFGMVVPDAQAYKEMKITPRYYDNIKKI